MALDGVIHLQQDEDSQYEQHERDAMKAIELSDLKKETCTLADKLENGLKDDIFAKNEEYVMRTEMGTLFASTVLPEGAPQQGEWEADSFFRIRIMKYLLKNALPKEWLPQGISAWVIDEKVPDLTTNDILALHYFQLLRQIPGKSNADAICGPLTMKDLLAANGVDLKDKLKDNYKESEDKVFVEFNGIKELVPQDSLRSNGSNSPVNWQNVVLTYKVWDKYVAQTKDGQLVNLYPPISDVWTPGDTTNKFWSIGFKRNPENANKTVNSPKNVESTDIDGLFGSEEYALSSINTYLKDNCSKILEKAKTQNKSAIDILDIYSNWKKLKVGFSKDDKNNLYCNLYDNYQYLWHINPEWFAKYDSVKNEVLYDDNEFTKQLIALGTSKLEKKDKEFEKVVYNIRIARLSESINWRNYLNQISQSEGVAIWPSTLGTFLDKNNMDFNVSIHNTLWNKPEKFWKDKSWNKTFSFTIGDLPKTYSVKIDDYFSTNNTFDQIKWQDYIIGILSDIAKEDAKPKKIKNENPNT